MRNANKSSKIAYTAIVPGAAAVSLRHQALSFKPQSTTKLMAYLAQPLLRVWEILDPRWVLIFNLEERSATGHSVGDRQCSKQYTDSSQIRDRWNNFRAGY